MPVKRLPHSLKKRLKKASPVIERYLGRMENIDHRAKRASYLPETNTTHWGRRVRQMDVSRNYPKTELVIKRADYQTASDVISILKQKVREHNRTYSPKNYVLVEPKAYAISDELIAMAKTDAPQVAEIIGRPGLWWGLIKTESGRKFWKGINQKQAHLSAFPKRWGMSKRALRKATEEVCGRTGIDSANMLLLGYKKGKFVFMPLVDLE